MGDIVLKSLNNKIQYANKTNNHVKAAQLRDERHEYKTSKKSKRGHTNVVTESKTRKKMAVHSQEMKNTVTTINSVKESTPDGHTKERSNTCIRESSVNMSQSLSLEATNSISHSRQSYIQSAIDADFPMIANFDDKFKKLLIYLRIEHLPKNRFLNKCLVHQYLHLSWVDTEIKIRADLTRIRDTMPSLDYDYKDAVDNFPVVLDKASAWRRALQEQLRWIKLFPETPILTAVEKTFDKHKPTLGHPNKRLWDFIQGDFDSIVGTVWGLHTMLRMVHASGPTEDMHAFQILLSDRLSINGPPGMTDSGHNILIKFQHWNPKYETGYNKWATVTATSCPSSDKVYELTLPLHFLRCIQKDMSEFKNIVAAEAILSLKPKKYDFCVGLGDGTTVPQRIFDNNSAFATTKALMLQADAEAFARK
jgi:hypothetical protein